MPFSYAEDASADGCVDAVLFVRERIGDHAEQLSFADPFAQRDVGEEDAAVVDADPFR